MTAAAALVLFSGGQDSTVCLAWALDRYARVETVGFAYGQRHAVELAQRKRVREESRGSSRLGRPPRPRPRARARRVRPHQRHRADARGRSAIAENRLPTTFVPGRNLVFFTYAAALAYRRDIRTLVGGMCETDYSGYPDCRNEALQTLARALSLGMDTGYTIETPLMFIDKAGTWALAERLGGSALVELIVEETHSCYLGIRSRRHAWGYGCDHCPACDLRKKGWERWQAQRT